MFIILMEIIIIGIMVEFQTTLSLMTTLKK